MNCPDSSDEDPVVAREIWYPIIANLFSRLRADDPERYHLPTVRENQPEIYRQIVTKSDALEALGDAHKSEIERTYGQILALFAQAHWRQKGYTPHELILDEDGDVRAVRIHGRNFGPARLHLQRLIGSWAAVDDGFCSPDGAPVYSVEDIEQLTAMNDSDAREFIERKLQ